MFSGWISRDSSCLQYSHTLGNGRTAHPRSEDWLMGMFGDLRNGIGRRCGIGHGLWRKQYESRIDLRILQSDIERFGVASWGCISQ